MAFYSNKSTSAPFACMAGSETSAKGATNMMQTSQTHSFREAPPEGIVAQLDAHPRFQEAFAAVAAPAARAERHVTPARNRHLALCHPRMLY